VLAPAAQCAQLSIYISCLQAAQQQTIAATDRWDSETDRGMIDRPLYRPCSAYYVGSIKNALCFGQ